MKAAWDLFCNLGQFGELDENGRAIAIWTTF